MGNAEGRVRREHTMLPNQAMSVVSGLLLLVALSGLLQAGGQLFDVLRGPGVKVGSNAGRLVRVAGLILLGGAVAPWLSWWGGREVLAHFGISRDLVLPPGGGTNLGFTALLLALVVLAGAEAFQRGRKLDEDAEGLV